MKSKNIKVIDENNIDRNANIMFALDLEGSEYVVYWIERDEESNNVFVSKVVKNVDNTFNLANIENTEEKEGVSKVVKDLISRSVSDENEKLVGDSLTLDDGKNIKFISVSFNKEQNFNVKQTYITTVKKEVTRVTENYYDVVVVESADLVKEDVIAVSPVVPEAKEEVSQDIFPEVAVSSEPLAEAPVVSTPTVEVDEFVPFETAPVVQEVAVTSEQPQTVEPVVVESITSSIPENDSLLNPAGVVAETVNVETPVAPSPAPVVPEIPVVETPKVVEPEVVPTPVVPTPIVEATPVVSAEVLSEPLMFNASKETNLNAALGEVANSTSIPVENIEPVREFGVDEPVQPIPVQQPVAQPVTNPVAADAVPVTNTKAGFANNKFFMVVAIAFFLASCVFLGYEVFNYFQLTK